MKVIINFIKGFHTIRKNFRLVIFLLLANFLFSLCLAVPMYTSLQNSLGQSEMNEKMEKGFDYLWWEEYRDQSRGLETTFSPSLLGKGAVLDNFVSLIYMEVGQLPKVVILMVLLYILFHTFLSGGILTVLGKEERKFSFDAFFSGAGKFATRFFLLMSVSWIFFYVIITFSGFIFSLINSLDASAKSEILPFYLRLGASLLTYFAFLFVQMVFDYARILTVAEDRSNIARSAIDAFHFVRKNPGSTLGLFYLLLLANVGLTFVFVLLKEILPQTAPLGITFVFVVQQIFIGAFIWIRCWLYSSQWALYTYLK